MGVPETYQAEMGLAKTEMGPACERGSSHNHGGPERLIAGRTRPSDHTLAPLTLLAPTRLHCPSLALTLLY